MELAERIYYYQGLLMSQNKLKRGIRSRITGGTLTYPWGSISAQWPMERFSLDQVLYSYCLSWQQENEVMLATHRYQMVVVQIDHPNFKTYEADQIHHTIDTIRTLQTDTMGTHSFYNWVIHELHMA